MKNIVSEWIIPVVSGSVLIALATLIGILIFYLQKRGQKHTKQMRELKQSYNQELLKSQLEIQEETLRYVSQEIHDNIGQVLSLAKLHLNTLPSMPSDENRVAITNSKQLVSKAINDLRKLSNSLYPNRVNELGLEKNIKYELEMLEKTLKYSASLQLNGSVYLISVPAQTILFRIVQECISNIIKHANANWVQIIMDYEPHQFCIFINDNGLGFNLAELTDDSQKGKGLKNMRYRSKIIGANFTIKNRIEGGTSIKICVPKNKLIGE